jgi:hypothetical protein
MWSIWLLLEAVAEALKAEAEEVLVVYLQGMRELLLALLIL